MSDDPTSPSEAARRVRPEKRSNAERVAELEARIRTVFQDKALALTALTHKSFCNETRNPPCVDNERLEFLGDAVVDLSISHRLMGRFPRAPEGELSKLRSLIVNEEGLVGVARTVGLGDLLLLGRGEDLSGGRNKPSVLADALEAVIGALYLDAGMTGVLGFVDAFFAEALDGVASGRQGQDYKSVLQVEAMVRFRQSPRYRTISESGPEHEKIFEVEVVIGNDTYGRSTGRSKKEAEQAAARETLARLAPKLPTPPPEEA